MRQYGPVMILMLGACGTAAGQAMVGYGMGAANATTTAAPARAIGRALEGVTRSSSHRIETLRGDPEPVARPKPAVHYEDPANIQTGMSYAELTHRFGPPSLTITGDDGTRMLTYMSKSAHAELVLKAGKVASVDVERIQHNALPQ